MAISINPATFVITVPKADLLFVSGTLYEHDTEAFRLELIAWEDDEAGMPFPRTHTHNTEVTIVGTTYARFIEIQSPYSVEYEDGAYSVRLAGSNNNFFDVENGVLVQNTVQIIAANSAGLIVNPDATLPDAEKDDIVDRLFAYMMENGETYAEAMRLVRAEAAGSIVKTGDIHEIKSADGLKTRITASANEDGRIVTDTDGL